MIPYNFSRSFLMSACLGMASFLAGCSSTPTKVSGELCSGTKRPYTINGKTYHPQDHYDYDEHGVASWYGPGFHNRPGSCGSIFDQEALTAAHKTLPIPSVVEVTNKKNGRKVKLVINDRGPFVGNRIIDLSHRAARELGTHGSGLGDVHVRALPGESKALANYLKQYGRYGIDPSGRSWDVIYRDHIEGRHHDIHDETPEEIKKHVQEEVLEGVLHPKQVQGPKNPLLSQESESASFDEILVDVENSVEKEKIVQKKSPTEKTSEKGKYLLVGSFIQKSNAQDLSKELTKYGRSQVIAENQTFFAVQMGPYQTQKEALRVLGTLKANGYRARLS